MKITRGGLSQAVGKIPSPKDLEATSAPGPDAPAGDQSLIVSAPAAEPSLHDLVTRAQEASKAVFRAEVRGEQGKGTFLVNTNTIATIEGKVFDANAGSGEWLAAMKQSDGLDDAGVAGLARSFARRRDEAQDQIKANEALELGALSRLAPEDQHRFLQVGEAIHSDPPARLALQMMLLEGRATPALLESLDELTTQPLANGLERSSLLADLVQEIHLPGAISQQNQGTCTVTSIEIKLARENPAEYVRIVASLASPAGNARLADGSEITRAPGTELPDHTARTASARLWQAAMMDLGNGELVYSNSRDVNLDSAGAEIRKGLSYSETARVLGAVTGRSVSSSDLSFSTLSGNLLDRASKAEIDQLNAMPPEDFDRLMRERVSAQRQELAETAVFSRLEAGQSLVVGLDWGLPEASGKILGGHELLATGVSTDEHGQTWIHLNNPWGQEEKLPKADFLTRLNEIHQLDR